MSFNSPWDRIDVFSYSGICSSQKLCVIYARCVLLILQMCTLNEKDKVFYLSCKYLLFLCHFAVLGLMLHKKNLSGLSLAPGGKLPKPLKFPKWWKRFWFLVSPLDHTWVYANEVTLGHSLDDLQDRGGVQKEQPHDWRVGILSQPNLQGGQWGLKTWVQPPGQCSHKSGLYYGNYGHQSLVELSIWWTFWYTGRVTQPD